MATKKRAKAKKATRRTAKRNASEAEIAALSGRAPRGVEWNAAEVETLRAALPEMKEPRPYTSRYPIPNEEFEALKAGAPRAKLRPSTAEPTRNSAQPKAELTRSAAPLAPGLAPSAAPSGSTYFGGIPATGWLPPDCTMAVGPSHVLLSVNSSVAIYKKTGGAPGAAAHADAMVLERRSGHDDLRSEGGLRSARRPLGAARGRRAAEPEEVALSVVGLGDGRSARLLAQLQPRCHEGRVHSDEQLGRLSLARARQRRALHHLQPVRVRRRIPICEGSRGA